MGYLFTASIQFCLYSVRAVMFVVSIMDNGNERNFVATDFRLHLSTVIIAVGAAEHVFPISDVIEVVPVRGASANDRHRPTAIRRLN
jgi:hypothetical protein